MAHNINESNISDIKSEVMYARLTVDGDPFVVSKLLIDE